ncbi:hypothetical protein TNCV_1794261 [Trichonephila clavipes]|nr:hypothetical protein TNCV_1794261 [Trichonephila clavipes]
MPSSQETSLRSSFTISGVASCSDYKITYDEMRYLSNLIYAAFNPPTGQNGFFRPTREASKMDCTDFSAFK